MALKYEIKTGPLPKDAKVASFRGSEQLSRPYVFEVFVAVPGDHDIEIEDAVGSKATLLIDDEKGPRASVGGILASFEIVRAVKGNALYAMRIVPRLWQLSLGRHSRVFTNKSIPDIIADVLSEEGITDFEMRLAGAYETEEHVTQYRESSLDFIHRWMEREGLYYFFEQTEDGEKMVIVDDLSKHEKVGPVRYHPASGDMSAGSHFDNFTARATTLPAQVKLTDYDYTKPSLDVTGSASVSPNGIARVHDSSSGARFFTPAAGARYARLRAEELRAEGATSHATGPALGLAPGYVFTLEDHPRSNLNKDYLVTHINHAGYISEVASAWQQDLRRESDDIYRVDLTAISADLQYRSPSRTTWPRIEGYENGIVDGPATSDYAQVDGHGRYLVKFKFDEGLLKDGKASTYVRMMQPHAGAIEGWHFPLRKGTEVVFLFLGGDPDRPVIAGAIPNATTPSPVTSGNNTRNVIQTGGRNRFELEDLAGQQRVTLSTPHANTYLRMGAANEDHEMIAHTEGRGLWNTVSSTHFTIGDFLHVTVGADKQEIVTGSVNETYLSTKGELVPNGLVSELYQAHMNIVATDSFRGVIGNTDDLLNGKWCVTNNGATQHQLNTSYELTVAGPWTIKTGPKEEKTDGTVNWEATGDIKIEAPVAEIECANKCRWSAPKCELEVGFWDIKVGGPKIEVTLGFKNDTVVGLTTELFGVKYENGIHEIHTKAQKQEAKALEQKLSGMETKIGALKNRASAMESRQNGMSSRMDGMNSRIHGLHNRISGLRTNNAGVHVVG